MHIRKSAFIIFLLFTPHLLLAETSIRHIYLTWKDEETHHNITVNIHVEGLLNRLHIYYDKDSQQNIPERYLYHVSALGTPIMNNTRTLFQVELTELEDDTLYYFTTGAPEVGYAEEKKFRTIPYESDQYRFVEGGDFEVTDDAVLIAKKAAEMGPHAALLGGDYPREVFSEMDFEKWDAWLDIYKKNMITPEGCLVPMVLAIGNHEVVGGFERCPEDAPFYFQYFPQNLEKKSYFLKRFGANIILFVLDSGHTARHQGVQERWLRKNMESNQEIPIKLATYHVPIYPSVRFAKKDRSYRIMRHLLSLCGKRNDIEKLLSPSSAMGRKYWLPIFDEYELTAAFEHHDQTLKRTKFLRRGEESPNGTLFLGDGGWGPRLRFTPIQSCFRSCFSKAIGHLAFFWLIEISKEKLTYKAITKDGQIVDECTQKINSKK